MHKDFKLISNYQPAGDQPAAIKGLLQGLQDGLAHQVLLGVTGSGKTYSVANVIKEIRRPTLILAHNKTLAAQLYGEMKEYFPGNAVEYFVSYYDYYQPEAYVPASDTYIEKDASINEHIEQMRLSATKALLERPDAIIVATVSATTDYGDEVGDISAVECLSLNAIVSGRIANSCLRLLRSKGTFSARSCSAFWPASSSRLAITRSLICENSP